jgi:hypothetical protein
MKSIGLNLLTPELNLKEGEFKQLKDALTSNRYPLITEAYSKNKASILRNFTLVSNYKELESSAITAMVGGYIYAEALRV